MKAVPSDLQSDPFDRSGNPPVFYIWSLVNDDPFDDLSAEVSCMSSEKQRGFRYELAEGLEPTTC